MPRKAQAEFALILGLLIIAIVVGIYAYSSTTPPTVMPSALTEEQKAVASYVGDMIREAATSTVSELYKNGGYLTGSTPAMGSISHNALGNNIALWQTCGSYNIPDMKQEFANGVKNYLQTNLAETDAIAGRTVTFGKQALIITPSFYDNKITLSVNLPTTVQGQAMPQPYVVEVSTKMGRIYDFAQNFARMQADCRVLDNHLLLSLAQSNEFSRPCWVPTVGNAHRSYTFTWRNLRDCMELHIKNSLSKTLLGKEFPIDDDGKLQVWGTELFAIPAVIDYSNVGSGQGMCTGTPASASSKKYDDLHVNFYFGDDNGLDRSEFSAPERLRIQPTVGPHMRFMGGNTVAEYSQAYSVYYPVVVNVWDSSLRRSFKFSVLVYLDNSNLGSCTAVPSVSQVPQNIYSQRYDDVCVEGATQDANILVKYKDGSDVVGATLSFVDCELGTTGSGLPIQAKVPPSWGELRIRDGRNEYVGCYSFSELQNIQIDIPKSKHFIFEFFTVGISKSGSTYTIDSVSPATKKIEVGMFREGDICAPPEPEYAINIDNDGRIVSEIDIANLPVDEYEVGVETFDGENLGGFVDMTGFTPAGSELYVYAPDIEDFEEADLEKLESLYASCGIDPISVAEYSGKVGCSWTG
jgi:hypothetical protein